MRAVVYFIKYSETQSFCYVCIRPFILIFFNIRVFHSPGSDKGFMLAFMRKRERERKKQRGGKRYRNYSTDSLPKRNNGQTNGNWFEFANDTGSRTRSAISFSFPSIPLGDACEKKKEGKESIRKFRFVTKHNKIYFLTSKSRQSFRTTFIFNGRILVVSRFTSRSLRVKLITLHASVDSQKSFR